MEAIRMITPFANEIANVLTTSTVKIAGKQLFKNLYRDMPLTTGQKISKVLIDLIALAGIILNVAHVASLHGERAGIAKGLAIVVLAFVIPNLTFHAIIDKVCYRCKPWMKLVFGLFLVGVLSGVELAFDYLVVERLHETKQ